MKKSRYSNLHPENWTLLGKPPMIQSAKLDSLDPYAYLIDVLKRLPT